MKTKNFPVLIEPRSSEFADRCVLSMADVLAIHFRNQNELEQYMVSSTPSFGMLDVDYLASPDLFTAETDTNVIQVAQEEFDPVIYEQLEARASIALLLRQIQPTVESVTFLKSITGDDSGNQNELLRVLSAAVGAERTENDGDLASLSSCLVDVISNEVLTSKSDTSPQSSLDVLDRVTAAVGGVNFRDSEFAVSLSRRLEKQREIITAQRTLVPLREGAASDLELLYGLLISMIRPRPSDFKHWIDTEESSVNAQICAAVFVGLRNHRWRILERSIRTQSEEIQLSRAVSAAMSTHTNRLRLDQAFLPIIRKTPSRSIQEVIVSGRVLKNVVQTINSDGTFTVRVVADSVVVGSQDEATDPTPRQMSGMKPKSSSSTKTRSGKKAIGSAMKEFRPDLFSDGDV
jgi:hypothetical protein